MYQTNIDTFIFTLKDDETTAILGIIFDDYPIIILTLIALCFTAFCIRWNFQLTKFHTIVHLRFRIVLPLVLLFILLYALALRGPFRHITMNVENYKFSKVESFNHLVLNPLMSFAFAHKMYKKENLNLVRANEKEGEILQKKLFPLFEISPKNPIAELQKPHIMVNLMESFGGQMLAFNNADFNLLGELKKHFETDFVFERFLPFANGTAPSLSFLFLNSPKTLSKSQYKKHYLPLSPIEIYKKQGYKVIFLTAGNRAWFGMGDFMRTQGVDELIDEIVISEEYAEANETRNSYGILDEFMYKKAFEILNTAKEPLLILALSASNHPPFPNVYESVTKDKIPNEILQKFPKNAHTIINTYIYANNEFGKFLNKIKASTLKDKVIIAATGDHRVRDMQSDFSTEQALSYAVPFYLYVPETYQYHINYNKNRIGSHKDIFPTLYALSLSEVEYLNMGGRNLLGEIKNPKYEFGYNEAVWLDEKGIYSANAGFHYANSQSLLNAESFVPDNDTLNFKQLYEQWLSYTLSLRLINLQEAP